MRDCILHGDCLALLKTLEENSVDALCCDPPSGIAFMGQNWDHDKGGRAQWVAWLCSIMQEALRVVKPGGHALVWALPRTSHWTATALEDAGWEIRDVITHTFGSGFPKSHDISKAIDKLAGAEREVLSIAPAKNSMGRMQESCKEQGARKYTKGISERLNVEKYGGIPVTAPATPDAQRWSGYGSALKPASEHWILARKPLAAANLASNVLEWGTGGLNIDASRVGYADGNVVRSSRHNVTIGGNGIYGGGKAAITGGHEAGRWPPNFLLSHSAAQLLDEQAGDEVSRFFPVFYAAKASRRERNAGCEALPVKEADYQVKHSQWNIDPRHPEGGYPVAPTPPLQNSHPTVKSLALMSWLVRLITPPSGTVLDCFAGSGSTLVACVQEGFHFIGMEQDASYVTIAQSRIAHAQREQKPAKPRAKITRLPKRPQRAEQLALFA